MPEEVALVRRLVMMAKRWRAEFGSVCDRQDAEVYAAVEDMLEPYKPVELDRAMELLEGVVSLAHVAMKEANRDGGEYDYSAELAESYDAIARWKRVGGK